MTKPRQYTTEEIRQLFVDRVRDLVNYWDTIPHPSGSRTAGVAFSILVMLDGGNVGMPGFVVAPAPHSSDKDYHASNGENWFPEAPEVEHDIAGSLHELFAQRK